MPNIARSARELTFYIYIYIYMNKLKKIKHYAVVEMTEWLDKGAKG